MLRSRNVGGNGVYWKVRTMDKNSWNAKLKEYCEAAGTYKPCFDVALETLADILTRRDEAAALYKSMGGRVVIGYTNKGGAKNPVKNPALAILDELNRSALPYLRDLGLTPAGLRKLSPDSDPAHGNGLGDILELING